MALSYSIASTRPYKATDSTRVAPGMLPPIISTTPNSPIVWANVRTKADKRPGQASGSSIRRKVSQGVMPLTQAASRTSAGKASKARCIGCTANGRLISTESDAFWLPDTAGTDYRRAHTKTTILLAEVDAEGERLGYFHNAGYHELSGEDFRQTFRLDAPPEAAFALPFFAERVRIDRVVHRSPGELADLSFELLRRHHDWRPRSNPFSRFAARLAQDLPAMRERGVENYHQWAFASVRQAGAAFELLAANLRWLGAQGRAPLTEAAEPFAAIAQANKTLILKGARAVATGKPLQADELLHGMAADWERGMAMVRAGLAES